MVRMLGRKRRWLVGLLVVAALGVGSTSAGMAGSTRGTGTVVLRGVDSQNLRPFTLTRGTDVVWSCPGCSSNNFIFETTQAPGVVNALNHTRGISFLARGHYSGVSVVGAGSWTITLRPAATRKVARSYILTGVDSENLRPFTLTHDSTVTWSCPGCSNNNFILETNEAPGVVNALNHTHGSSFMPKGHYTGVSVTGAGYWKIAIR
jgi:predicted nucleic-acid-binding Zn-ribbon protein